MRTELRRQNNEFFFKFVKTTYAPVLNVIFIISRSNQFLFDASVSLQRYI